MISIQGVDWRTWKWILRGERAGKESRQTRYVESNLHPGSIIAAV